MWRQISLDLYEMSSDKYNEDLPEIKLFAVVIIEAAKDRDMQYFKSWEFVYHTTLLRIDAFFIQKVIKKCWNVEDSGEIWSLTAPIEGFD